MSEISSDSENKCWWLKTYGITNFPIDERGKGVTVAILDSGISQDYPDLKSVKISGSKNFILDDNNITDILGHGTNCAGILVGAGPTLYGVAPAVSILVGKIANTLKDINEGALCNGIDWAVEKGADIISISVCIGGNKIQSDGPLHESVRRAFAKNILIVAAVGDDRNAGYDIDNYPASFDECLSVGSVDRSGKMADFTSSNSKTKILAPGVDIPAIMPLNDHSIIEGTSFSAPFVSGVLAMMMSVSKKNSKDAMDILLASSTMTAGYKDSNPIKIIDPIAAMK
jgi:major intracellular serine protease